jgi:uncharacterized damage-inducible protein DinB
MLSQILVLNWFDYNHEINNRLLELAAKVTPKQWDMPHNFGRCTSLRETLFHVLSVEEEWLALCETGTPDFGFRSLDDYPDAASLQTYSDQVYRHYFPYIESLNDQSLTARITAMLPDNREHSIMVWQLLSHMLYHSAYHRSEIASMLTSFGQSPGAIDFFGFRWD